MDVEEGAKAAAGKKECRLYRLGKTYRTMDADNRVYHRSDLASCPKGLS